MKKLLIVVDMINDFCEKGGVLAKSLITGQHYGIGAVAWAAGDVDAARARDEPIIWLCDSHDKDDKEFDRFPPHAIKDTWGAEVVADLLPRVIENSPNEIVINKTRYSGFYGTNLESHLFQLAPDEVTVIGVCTSICVMDTVGGLANRDFSVNVIKKAVADFSPSAHTAALGRMEALYGAKII